MLSMALVCCSQCIAALHNPHLQVLAAGNCVDGSVCGAGKAAATCRAATTMARRYSPEEAIHNEMFSSAYLLFGPGTHTVLIRINSYMGCGTGGVADCYSSAVVDFKAMTCKPNRVACCQSLANTVAGPGALQMHGVAVVKLHLLDRLPPMRCCFLGTPTAGEHVAQDDTSFPTCHSLLPAAWRLGVPALPSRHAVGATGAAI